MANYLISLALGAGLTSIWCCGNSSVETAQVSRASKETEAQVQRPSEQEVHFTGNGLELVGTLEMPSHVAAKPLPAVLLLPGSGPTDRDGNQLPAVRTDLLMQIAERLAGEGIISLRFDKRATKTYVAQWPKKLEGFNDFDRWRNFVDDASAAYRFLRRAKGVDPSRVAILGHSEGGLIALQMASDLHGSSESPAALVLASTGGRPMGQILHEQIARQLKAGLASASVSKKYLDYVDSTCKSLAKGGGFLPDPPQGLGVLFNPTVLDIMQAYCRIDPIALAADYSGPVLLVNGSQDTQVSPDRDATRLDRALKARHKGSVEAVLVPNASHNLKSTGAGDDNAFEGPVAPEAMNAIAAFLHHRL